MRKILNNVFLHHVAIFLTPAQVKFQYKGKSVIIDPPFCLSLKPVLFNLWTTERFAVGHRAFWLKSYFEQVVLECLLAGDHLLLAGKTT